MHFRNFLLWATITLLLEQQNVRPKSTGEDSWIWGKKKKNQASICTTSCLGLEQVKDLWGHRLLRNFKEHVYSYCTRRHTARVVRYCCSCHWCICLDNKKKLQFLVEKWGKREMDRERECDKKRRKNVQLGVERPSICSWSEHMLRCPWHS